MNYADALTRAIECSSATEEEKKRMLELYMETMKTQTVGELMDSIDDNFEFEFSLYDLVSGRGVFQCLASDRFYSRDPTPEELNSVVYEGKTLRFLVEWSLDGQKYEERTIPEKRWKKGDRWTMRDFLGVMKNIYSRQKNRDLKRVGDHVFFGGIMEDGTVYLGS
jgi:hypothetical protein